MVGCFYDYAYKPQLVLARRFASRTMLVEVKKKMNKQREIFKDKHTHIQTLLYIKTLGSFVGYSMAYPKLIQDTFGYLRWVELGTVGNSTHES